VALKLSASGKERSEGRAEAPRALGPRTRRYAGIVESIGDTPTIEIPRLAASPDVHLFAKLEAANPTGSIKDRVARALIEDLEAKGRLHAGSIILEATSGNTGIALAMIGRRKGYRVAVVMPDNVTLERRQLVALHGAEVIDSPGAAGSNGAIALARELVARDPQFVMADQYANPANPRVHEETTGPEILDAVPELDVFVAGLGTGGTLTGVGRFLRRAKPGVRIVAAEPLPGEAVQGLRSLDDGFVPEIFDPSLLDDRYVVANRDAVETARELLEREGVLAGPSSGAILWVAARVAEQMEGGGTIVALLPDGGWKYLSTGTYSRPLDEMEDELEGGVAWW
jgi:cysteine synthase B